MSLARDLHAYQQYHTKLITRLTHYVGIPLVLFSSLLFLGWIHISVPNFFDMPLAWLVTLFVLIYYFFLDITLAASMTVILILLNLIAAYFSQPVPTKSGLQVFLITFILGWILQFVGHLFESKKPAFLSNIKALLIGPLFIVAEVFFHFGYKQKLKAKIDASEF